MKRDDYLKEFTKILNNEIEKNEFDKEEILSIFKDLLWSQKKSNEQGKNLYISNKLDELFAKETENDPV